MKKIVILIGLCLVGFVTMAQDVDDVNNAAFVSKRGVYLLPQAGDFALGVDAAPFLEYLGNIFMGVEAPYFGTGTIYGKYFLDDNRALRAKLKMDVFNRVSKAVLDNDDGPGTVIDNHHRTSADIDLGLGLEFRRGHGRVQGYFGGEAIVGFGFGSGKFTRGNPMTEDNPFPTTYDFGMPWMSFRPTKYNDGITFNIGVGAFVGVEYFFAPQISFGADVGYGLKFNMTGRGQTTYESMDGDDRVTHTTKSDAYRHEASKIGLIPRPTASIFLMFHF